MHFENVLNFIDISLKTIKNFKLKILLTLMFFIIKGVFLEI